jgi:imidazolonepropionase-like amidohydrolase
MSTLSFMRAAILAAIIPAAPAAIASTEIAVRGETIHTMAGEPIEDGVVVVIGGRIAAIGPAGSTTLPDGIRVLEARVVTPGLIDARSVVGIAGYLNQSQDQDQIEMSTPIQPELRAIDAYNGRDRLVAWVRQFGVTTLHTGHAPGWLVSGQTMIVKTHGEDGERAVVEPTAMVAATLGEGATQGPRRRLSFGPDRSKAPGTRSKAVALLRAELIRAREYLAAIQKADADKSPARDLRLEALGRVLQGEIPLLLTAHRHQDLKSALRIKAEFDIPMVLDGAAESYLMIDAIRAAGVPVVIHPTMARAFGEADNLSMATAAKLQQAGIPVALQSGYEPYVPKTRVVLFEAAVAAAHGMPFDRALAAITIDAAKILGVEERLGSLEIGKDGDLALYDGDPFEYTSHCTGVIIEGEVVSDQSH